mgnify:CR=1 FL=1
MLVDTNILIDVLEDDPQWANWSIKQLQVQSIVHKHRVVRSTASERVNRALAERIWASLHGLEQAAGVQEQG